MGLLESQPKAEQKRQENRGATSCSVRSRDLSAGSKERHQGSMTGLQRGWRDHTKACRPGRALVLIPREMHLRGQSSCLLQYWGRANEASLGACRHEHRATGAHHDSPRCPSHPLTLLDGHVTGHKPSGNTYSYLSGEEARTRKPEFSKHGRLYVPLL